MTVEIPILDVCTFSISGPNMNMIRTTQRVFKRYPKTSMHGWYVIAFAHFFSGTWGWKQEQAVWAKSRRTLVFGSWILNSLQDFGCLCTPPTRKKVGYIHK